MASRRVSEHHRSRLLIRAEQPLHCRSSEGWLSWRSASLSPPVPTVPPNRTCAPPWSRTGSATGRCGSARAGSGTASRWPPRSAVHRAGRPDRRPGAGLAARPRDDRRGRGVDRRPHSPPGRRRPRRIERPLRRGHARTGAPPPGHGTGREHHRPALPPQRRADRLPGRSALHTRLPAPAGPARRAAHDRGLRRPRRPDRRGTRRPHGPRPRLTGAGRTVPREARRGRRRPAPVPPSCERRCRPTQRAGSASSGTSLP